MSAELQRERDALQRRTSTATTGAGSFDCSFARRPGGRAPSAVQVKDSDDAPQQHRHQGGQRPQRRPERWPSPRATQRRSSRGSPSTPTATRSATRAPTPFTPRHDQLRHRRHARPAPAHATPTRVRAASSAGSSTVRPARPSASRRDDLDLDTGVAHPRRHRRQDVGSRRPPSTNARPAADEGSPVSVSFSDPVRPELDRHDRRPPRALQLRERRRCPGRPTPAGQHERLDELLLPRRPGEPRPSGPRIIDKDGGFSEYTTDGQRPQRRPERGLHRGRHDGARVDGSAEHTLQLLRSARPGLSTPIDQRHDCSCGSRAARSSRSRRRLRRPTSGAFDELPVSSTVRRSRDRQRQCDRLGPNDDRASPRPASVTRRNVRPDGRPSPTTGPVDEGSPVSGQLQRTSSTRARPTRHRRPPLRLQLLERRPGRRDLSLGGSGTIASTNCTFPDGPASKTVRRRISDKDGGFTVYTRPRRGPQRRPRLTVAAAAKPERSKRRPPRPFVQPRFLH